MSAPNGPMPLANQVKAGGNIVVTVPLRAMGPAPTFIDGQQTFNAADPTATFTIPVGSVTTATPGAITGAPYDELTDVLDRMWREGTATVT